MSEQTTVAQNGQSNESTVSKSEFEKLQALNSQTTKDLETLKEKLLDEEYLQYLADRKAGKQVAAPANNPGVTTPISSMTLAQLQQVIATEIGRNLEPIVKPIYGRINELTAKEELRDVEGRYADFNEFRDQVVSLLESSPNAELSIEQAYLQAKGIRASETPTPVKEAVVTNANEKPGGTVPLAGESAQRHKDANAAGQAAWAEVRGKYGLQGDTI